MGALDRRIGLLFVAFVALLSVALVRATYLGAVRSSTLKRAAATQQVTTVVTPAPRGTITDRRGVELAVSESADDIVADPYLIVRSGQAQTDAQKLAPLLGQPFTTVLTQLTKPHTGFVYLTHLLPGPQANQIARLRIEGINLIPGVKRFYPRSWEASQVLGFVGAQGQGLWGLEGYDNRLLSGQNGVRKVVSDAVGQAISVTTVHPTVPGRSLQLTIDAGLQDYVEQVLAGVGAQYSPKSATAIVADPRTGAILALANWPRFNANDPFHAPQTSWEDQAVGFSYEPGSTFKGITVAGALQDGLITRDTPFNIPPSISFASNQPPIHDAESHGYETLSVANILKYSSNIGADLIGQRLGAQRFDYWVHRFGFGSPTKVDLPGEQRGIVLHASQYSGASMFNLPFGQGESVTPMQMIAAYDAIANGGVLRAPHIVEGTGGKQAVLPRGQQILSPGVARDLREMLRGVFADGGTASGAAIPGWDMAGKTGTANVAVSGKYSSSAYIASFIGMVPTENPKLVVDIVVDRPQGSIYGGSVAAPAFQKIVGWAVPYLGISPQ